MFYKELAIIQNPENFCSNTFSYSLVHCPQENFKKMCIIINENFVSEYILYDLSYEETWKIICELSAKNSQLIYKDSYEIRYSY